MNKKKKQMFLLISILVLLLAVLFVIKTAAQKQEEENAREEEASVVYINQMDNIVGISYDAGNGEMVFEKSEDVWTYVPDPDFPLNSSYPENIVYDFSALAAERELEGADDPADYGIDEPLYTITLTDTEKGEETLYFGDMSGDNYYVMAESTGKIYTVSSTVLTNLDYTLEEMAKLDELPSIGSGNLVKEEIIRDGESTVYDSENEDDTENIAAVAGGLGALTLSEAADYSVEDEDLAEFGLDEASRITVKATYTTGSEEEKEENIFILYMGDEDGNGNRYVMVEDSRIVYLISTEVCANILNE